MYGFQGMHSSSKEVNELVDAFADLYERSNVRFISPYDASTALYSMQGLSSNMPFSRRLLSLIATSSESVKGKYAYVRINIYVYTYI
jgi:hypothetical protein